MKPTTLVTLMTIGMLALANPASATGFCIGACTHTDAADTNTWMNNPTQTGANTNVCAGNIQVAFTVYGNNTQCTSGQQSVVNCNYAGAEHAGDSSCGSSSTDEFIAFGKLGEELGEDLPGLPEGDAAF